METSPSVNQRKIRFEALCDIKQGEVFKRDTSYLGEQNEVSVMVDAMKGQQHWPGAWYEILQGALDFNDNTQGPPQIEIYYEGKDKPVSLAQYTQDNQRIFKPKVAKVVTSNYIRKGTGLRPGNVVLTEHESKDDNDTLGTHGRGLKIASTAICANRLAEKISFSSYADGIGSWYGEANMAKDPIDPQSKEFYQLKYKRDQDLAVEKTEIIVHKPGKELCESLAQFQDWFLPTNPNYRFYRLEGENKPSPNLLTVFTHEKNIQTEHDSSFNEYDLMMWGQRSTRESKGNEPPRVEIIPNEILSNIPAVIDFVYIDGLRVKVNAQLTHIYSFWGWGKGYDYGHNPKRSNDSLRMENSPQQLIGNALTHCDNPEIFTQILRSMVTTEPRMYEADIYKSTLMSISNIPASHEAFKTGWQKLKQEYGITDKILVTASSNLKDRADREEKRALLFQAENWSSTVVEICSDAESLDEVFEQEAAEERAKTLQLQRELFEQKIKSEREKAEAVEAERQRWLENRGITREAENTGEVVKVASPENPKVSLEIARLHLIHSLSVNHGYIAKDAESGQLTLEMEAGDFDRIPQNTGDLGHLGDFVKSYLTIFGGKSELEIRVVKNGKGVYYNFSRSSYPDNFGNYSIHIKQGGIAMDTPSLVRIDCKPTFSPHEDSLSSQHSEDAQSWHEYHQSITDAINGLLGDDNRIDRNKYLESQFYRDYPFAEALIRTRQALEDMKEQARKDYAAENARRKKAGLPPLKNPFEEHEYTPIITDSSPTPHPDTQEGSESIPDKRKPVAPSAYQNQQFFDDAPIAEGTLHLIHPDSIPGMSRHGKKERLQMYMEAQTPAEKAQQALRERLREALRRQISPDFTLASGEFSKITGYLISHISPAYSNISTGDYIPIDDLPYQQKHGQPHLRFNKRIASGLHTLYCPPGYKPVTYHHPDSSLNIYFSGIPEKGVYAFTSDADIPKGLSFFFEKSDIIDDSIPDEKESSVIANIENLKPHWKNLIDALNQSSLSTKQKHDIVLRAWVKAFNYDQSQETFDLYEDSRHISTAFASDIINNSTGNCGYAMRGFHGLISLIGIPSREIASFLHDGFGNYSQRECYHAMNQSYIDGHWVLVEPQADYVEPGYELEVVPAESRQLFENLLDAIPTHTSINPTFLDRMPAIIPQHMPPIREIANEIVEAAERSLPFELPHLLSPSKAKDYLTYKYLLLMQNESLARTTRLAANLGLVGLFISKALPFLTDKVSAAAPQLTTTPLPTTTATPLPTPIPPIPTHITEPLNTTINFNEIPQLISHILEPVLRHPETITEPMKHMTEVPPPSIPPHLLVPALLIGAAAGIGIGVGFKLGRMYERQQQDNQNKPIEYTAPENNETSPFVEDWTQ